MHISKGLCTYLTRLGKEPRQDPPRMCPMTPLPVGQQAHSSSRNKIQTYGPSGKLPLDSFYLKKKLHFQKREEGYVQKQLKKVKLQTTLIILKHYIVMEQIKCWCMSRYKIPCGTQLTPWKQVYRGYISCNLYSIYYNLLLRLDVSEAILSIMGVLYL